MNKKAIIVFQKNKELGKVKTRLAKDVGDEKALRYYTVMIEHTHEQLKKVEANVIIYYSAFIPEFEESNFQQKVQHGEDLGIRMMNAFQEVKDLGYQQIVIIGTDCLEMNDFILNKAFEALNDSDFVIGPATDGGYYLLGLNEVLPSLFIDRSWSNEHVFQNAIDSISAEHKSVSVLPTLNDIDNLEDLKAYESNFGEIKI